MSILDMFARSPIRPLQQHMAKAYECVELLIPFFEMVLACNWQKAADVQSKISHREHEADEIKRDLRSNLPKSLLLPVSRGDLLSLLKRQESLANIAKDISGLMLGRQMQIPELLTTLFQHYVERSVAAARQAKKAIDELDELLSSGFRGKEVEVVDEMIAHLNDIESETDRIQVQLRAALFDIEKSLQPVNVMFLYQIIKQIGYLANFAEQIGYELQVLLAD